MTATENYFVGVDGGGSKSRLRIESADGKLLAETMAGPGSIRLSVEKSWDAINSAFNKAVKMANLDLKEHRFYAGMGLAGCEIPEAYQQFINTPHPFAVLELQSDAHAACLGAHNGKHGAIIIIGTGTIGYAIHDNKIIRVGGWGFPQGDEGSGAWLGLEAIRLTLHWIDGRIEETPLLKSIFDEFGGHVQQFISWTSYAKSTDFARFAPLVIQHSHLQDPWAIKLLKEGARNIEEMASTINKKNGPTPLPICLFGGLAPHIEPWLSEDLRKQIKPRVLGATEGAVIMIKQKMGLWQPA